MRPACPAQPSTHQKRLSPKQHFSTTSSQHREEIESRRRRASLDRDREKGKRRIDREKKKSGQGRPKTTFRPESNFSTPGTRNRCPSRKATSLQGQGEEEGKKKCAPPVQPSPAHTKNDFLPNNTFRPHLANTGKKSKAGEEGLHWTGTGRREREE